LSVYDKYFIKQGLGDVQLAEYAMGFMLGQAVLLLTDAFNKSWSPHALKRLSEGDTTIMRDVKKYALFTLLAAPFVGGAFYLFACLYLPPHYTLAPMVAAFSAVAFTVQVVYFLVFPFLIHSNKVKYIGAISSLATIIGGIVLTTFVKLGFLSLIPLGYMVTFAAQACGVLFAIRQSR
jgi:O-antigen/teichoic acid export membrane protein